MAKIPREKLKDASSDERKEYVDQLREESQTFKGRTAIEWRKVKSMQGGELRAHIWDYYRIHILAVIILIAVAAYSIHLALNPPPDSILTVAFVGGWLPEEYEAAIAEALAENLVEDPNREMVQILVFTVTDEDPHFTMMNHQRFAAMTTVREIDMVIGNLATFEGEVEGLGMAPAISYMDLIPLFEEAGLALPAEPVIAYDIDDDYTPFAFAISVADSNLFEDVGLFLDGFYLGVMINTQRLDAVVHAIGAIWQN